MSELPSPHVSPVGMYATKLGLRFIQFALSIAMIGLVGSAMNAGFWALSTLVISAPPTVVSAVWALAEGICIMVRGGHRGIHPGACVAVDLLLWLAFIATTLILWFLGIATAIVGGSLDGLSNFNRDPDDWTSYSDPVSETLSDITAKGQALIGLGATLVVLHFTTFVIACYETSVRNRAKHQTTFIHVTSQYEAQQQPVYLASPGQEFNGSAYIKA